MIPLKGCRAIGTVTTRRCSPKPFAMRQNCFFRSVVVGVIGAIAFGVVAFAFAHFFDAVLVYAAPGVVFLPLVPTKLAYWLDPDGGPAVGVFLLVVCALRKHTVITPRWL
jgi:hypothetical protein